MNWLRLWIYFVKRRKVSSWILLFGGVCGAVAIRLMPIPGAYQYWYLPLLFGWGSAPGLLANLVMFLYLFVRGKL